MFIVNGPVAAAVAVVFSLAVALVIVVVVVDVIVAVLASLVPVCARAINSASGFLILITLCDNLSILNEFKYI